MSNFLEIKKGHFLKAENIEAIEQQDESVVKVYTSGNVYDSDIPIKTFLSILEMHCNRKNTVRENNIPNEMKQFVSL